MNTQNQIMSKVELHKFVGQQICQEILQAIYEIGFTESDISELPDFAKAQFSLTKDPYTADENLTGCWYDQRQQKVGQIQFNSDDSFYAEYDIVKPHPTQKQWFVESMSAWGKDHQINTEAILQVAL